MLHIWNKVEYMTGMSVWNVYCWDGCAFWHVCCLSLAMSDMYSICDKKSFHVVHMSLVLCRWNIMSEGSVCAGVCVCVCVCALFVIIVLEPVAFVQWVWITWQKSGCNFCVSGHWLMSVFVYSGWRQESEDVLTVSIRSNFQIWERWLTEAQFLAWVHPGIMAQSLRGTGMHSPSSPSSQ